MVKMVEYCIRGVSVSNRFSLVDAYKKENARKMQLCRENDVVILFQNHGCVFYSEERKGWPANAQCNMEEKITVLSVAATGP